ncbi:MAG: 4Fe-4S dicluster domain-containing protein [Nitrospirota bacterium]
MAELKSFFVDTTECIACRGCQMACKQWNQRAAEKTYSRGSHQNPPDLSYNMWKLVRFSEVAANKYYFFPDQCRHCLEPPCKMTAESLGSKAITKESTTGAVLFSPKIKVKAADFKKIREACPWNIPRWNEKSEIMAKCTMCFDRVKEGLLPACVKACPTKAMNFGDRSKMLDMARNREKELKPMYPKAQALNIDFHQTIFFVVDDPQKYHKFAAAMNTAEITRMAAIKSLIRPLLNFAHFVG